MVGWRQELFVIAIIIITIIIIIVVVIIVIIKVVVVVSVARAWLVKMVVWTGMKRDGLTCFSEGCIKRGMAGSELWI